MAKAPQIILIDGPAGSGKTTLSKELQSEFDCQVVHLDDCIVTGKQIGRAHV